MNEPHVIILEHPDPATAQIFAEADRHPVLVEIGGTLYRIEREDHYLYYHPEERQENKDDNDPVAHGKGDFRRIIREVKPKAKSLEWGPETRYGREDDFNNGYNEALDEYENALFTRIDAET